MLFFGKDTTNFDKCKTFCKIFRISYKTTFKIRPPTYYKLKAENGYKTHNGKRLDMVNA